MWTAIATLAIQCIGWFISRQQNNAEMQKLFLDFVEKFNDEYLNSAKLKKSYQEQRQRLDNLKPQEPLR